MSDVLKQKILKAKTNAIHKINFKHCINLLRFTGFICLMNYISINQSLFIVWLEIIILFFRLFRRESHALLRPSQLRPEFHLYFQQHLPQGSTHWSHTNIHVQWHIVSKFGIPIIKYNVLQKREFLHWSKQFL